MKSLQRGFAGLGSLVIGLFIVAPSVSHALPFNDDMVHDQYKVSEVMRSAPKDTFALGSLDRYVSSREEATKLENPVQSSEASRFNGKRLWDVNCVPCHGRYTGEPMDDFPTWAEFEKPIDPVVAGPTSGVNLVTKAYIEDQSKTDGHLFGYIYFGGLAIMPRYGYKLSVKEHWDIVNYIRSMQDDFSATLGLASPKIEASEEEVDASEDEEVDQNENNSDNESGKESE